MDDIEEEERWLSGRITAAFSRWKSQIRRLAEERDGLRHDLAEQSRELSSLKEQVAKVDTLRHENERLQGELQAALRIGPPGSRQLQDHLDKHAKLCLEDHIKQAKIDVLEGQVRKQKEKLRRWASEHGGCSSSPRIPPATRSGKVQPNPHKLLPSSDLAVISADNAEGEACISHTAAAPFSHVEFAGAQQHPLEHGTPRPSLAHDRVNSVIPAHQRGDDDGPQNGHDPTSSRRSAEAPQDPAPIVHSGPNSSHDASSPELPPLPLSERLPPSAACRKVSISASEAPKHPLPDTTGSESTAPPAEDNLIPTFDEGPPTDQPRHIPCVSSVASSSKQRHDDSCQSSAHPCDAVIEIPKGSRAEPIVPGSGQSSNITDIEGRQGEVMSLINGNFETTKRIPSFGTPRKDRRSHLSSSASSSSTLQTLPSEVHTHNVDRAVSEPAENQVQHKAQGHLSDRKTHPSPLQEIDGNRRAGPKPEELLDLKSRKRKSNNARGANAVEIIAEDGEQYKKRLKAGKTDTSVETSPNNISAFHRLGNLLDEPSPPRPTLSRPSPESINMMNGYLYNSTLSAAPKDKEEMQALQRSRDKNWSWYESVEALLESRGLSRPSRSSPELNHDQYQHGPSTARRLKSDYSPGKSKLSATVAKLSRKQIQEIKPRSSMCLAAKPKTTPGPEDSEPFRSRPLHRLSLLHFKPRNNVDSSLDYAYTDVVRNREQRKCLPGCTRPECCGGKFRAIASALQSESPHSGKLSDSSPLASLDPRKDDEVLENFLGPGSEEKIRTLTKMARENLLLEAKTKIAADKFGKMHRYAHERARSPPGFWRSDMPGTQEQEEDREDASRRERQEVERRYVEACQENGRWKFADE